MAFTVSEVKKKIQELSEMSELDPGIFCEEEGLADSLVQEFKKQRKDLKPTQLRKVFHELKAIQRDVLKEIKEDEDKKKPFHDRFRKRVIKLMPAMAYATGRDLIPKDFYELMKMCLSPERLKTYGDFLRLSEFTEAIMAYHKFRQ
ncbi:MAG: type III-A CRISPR-associated protein Csm2 [Nitrospirota bacterium]